MKKLILVLGFLFLGIGVVGFFYGVGATPGNALLWLGLFGLLSVPCFALVSTMTRVEQQEESLRMLQGKLRRLEDSEPPAPAEPPVLRKTEARRPWDCTRCGTVNKTGTAACAQCGALYDEWTGTSR